MTDTHDHNNDWEYQEYPLDTSASEFAEFQSIVEVWNSKRSHNKMPAWKDFNLEDFCKWYGWLAVGDIIESDVFNLRYRLWGTNFTDFLGVDLTGKTTTHGSEKPDEYIGGFDQIEFDFLISLTSSPSIGVSVGSMHWHELSHRKYKELTLPLADDGENVDKLLHIIYPLDRTL